MKYTLILSYTVTFRRSEVKKKNSSGIADVTVEYVTSRTSKYKPHAAIMLATKQISIQWKLQLSVSLMLIHVVIYPVDTAFQLLNNWGLVQELKIFSGYCWWCCSFCIENLPFTVLMTFLSSKRYARHSNLFLSKNLIFPVSVPAHSETLHCSCWYCID